MDHKYERHNRSKYSLKVHIVLVTKFGRKRYFGQMDLLLVVLEKYHQPLYKSTLRAKVNGYEFTRFLPPPKGSGFLPTKNERI